MKENITREFKNTNGLVVFCNDGYFTIEDNDTIWFQIYDDGDWDKIKEAIQDELNEINE